MIEGESGILAVCPPWERPEYRPSKRQLEWPNGAKSLIFTADEPERLRGKQHMRFWGDEVAAWRYEESLDQALLGLRLGPDPRALLTTTPKPKRIIKQLLRDATCRVTKGTTYDNLDNLAPAFASEIITRYEGTRLGKQELLAEVLLDEGLAYPDFKESVHTVPAFPLPNEWDRFEHMDYGLNNPTAWHLTGVDFDGNLIVAGEYYSPGLVSAHAAAVKQLRAAGWERRDEDGYPERHACFGDPAIRARTGGETKLGDPASVLTEFAEHGIGIAAGNNDRVAGYGRISELLRPDPERIFPAFHPLSGEKGAPRLFIMHNAPHLIEQIGEAPIEEPEKVHGGEAIAAGWESAHGHAHASLRYGIMSRPGASKRPVHEPTLEDGPAALRAAALQRRIDRRLKQPKTPHLIDL